MANVSVTTRSDGSAQTPPAVPASTSALTNPFLFGCLVTVRGGTVTVIAVDGTTVGTINGTFILPNGSTITLTYAVAPTWTWYGPV